MKFIKFKGLISRIWALRSFSIGLLMCICMALSAVPFGLGILVYGIFNINWLTNTFLAIGLIWFWITVFPLMLMYAGKMFVEANETIRKDIQKYERNRS